MISEIIRPVTKRWVREQGMTPERMLGTLCRPYHEYPDLVGRRVFEHYTPYTIILDEIEKFEKEYKEVHFWPDCWKPVLIGITRGD